MSKRAIDKIGNMLKRERFKDDWARHARTSRKHVESPAAHQQVNVVRYDENGKKINDMVSSA